MICCTLTLRRFRHHYKPRQLSTRLLHTPVLCRPTISPPLSCRHSLQSRSLSTSNDKDDPDNRRQHILYERNPEANFGPKVALSLSWLSLVYATWYAIDFLPVINNSGIADLYVNPAVGLAGVGITGGLTATASAYARQMVSKIVLQEKSLKPIQVYRHSLPFMLPSSKPMECKYGQALLDVQSDDVKKLMSQMESGNPNITGHMPLKTENRRWPLAIYLTSMADVKNIDLFQDALLLAALRNPQRKKSRRKKGSRRR